VLVFRMFVPSVEEHLESIRVDCGPDGYVKGFWRLR
jgi:hypothetical protein